MVSLEEYLSTVYEPDCDFVDGTIEERNLGEWDHALVQSNISAYLHTHSKTQERRVLTALRLHAPIPLY